MTLEEAVIALRAEDRGSQEALAAALERIAELEQGVKPPSSFAKANKPKKAGPKVPRRKRKPEPNRARAREEGTKIGSHKREHSPDCGCRVYGQSGARRREVIDSPPLQPVEITEHQVIKRWCPKRGRWHAAKLDLRGQVLGLGPFGVHLASLITYLRTALRLPVCLIREYSQTTHQVSILKPGS